MEPFKRLTAVACPLDAENVDTDQIVPGRCLRHRDPAKVDWGRYVFHELRFGPGEVPNPDFVLNRPEFEEAKILVAGKNFGCGSSREQAVWCLFDYGFRAVLAPSFGDIFFSNCTKFGLLPVVLETEIITALRADLRRRPGSLVTVDLEGQIAILPDGSSHRFEIPALAKRCLLEGLTDADVTDGYLAELLAFEDRQRRAMPWLDEPR